MKKALKVTKVFDHGLSQLEIEHKLKEIAQCKERGVLPTKCDQCKKESKYLYSTTFKRGGTQYHFFCDQCYDRTSKDKEISKEDYDCL